MFSKAPGGEESHIMESCEKTLIYDYLEGRKRFFLAAVSFAGSTGEKNAFIAP